MHRAALEGVVEILAMAAVPLTKARAAALMVRVADGRAQSLVIPRCDRGLDVVLVAHGDTEADDVDQQLLAFAPHRRWQRICAQRCDLAGQHLGDGRLGKLVCHVY
jgi:hypothetical protein